MNDIEKNAFDSGIVSELVTFKMPFGKYKDRLLCELPDHYVTWFHQKGFPPGKLGMLLATLYEIKLNGLEYLLKPLRKQLSHHTENRTE